MAYEQLKGQVPIPEVYGWAEDGGQGFLYMSLIEGDTLEERWTDMSEEERQAVCNDIRPLVQAWRGLKQDKDASYIGSVGKRRLKDISIGDRPTKQGPFLGVDAVEQFHTAGSIEIRNDIPIVFTHADLVAPNSLLTKGPNPTVAAIIDWGQPGWYPEYWEFCKARRVGWISKYRDNATLEEWRSRYMPMFLDRVDDETIYHPWLYFHLSNM
ncbi:hypothetical protein FQN57_000444 [Myotisia sp. PD_48]|nr:hypothetical protein FQN57_000444 [Myotisia sp. PD_48]